MAKTINFCGDSFCLNLKSPAWTYLLADYLKCDILGGGKGGAAHEHAFQSFNESADFTVFCWTEPDRIYHADYPINSASAQYNKKTNKTYAAAHAYYSYVHDFEHSKTRQMRELYWFDHEILSKYLGKIIHCWSFKKTYEFSHGVSFDTPLFNLSFMDPSSINHMTIEQNYEFANQLHNLIRRTYG